MTDQELIAQFESGSLPPTGFHHTDHVRMAFAYLRQCPVLSALERFSTALKHFAKAQGRANLYHQTITWAYLFLIHQRMSQAPQPQTWEQFANANPDLFEAEDSILKKYYTEETLRSELARSVFVFPDRCSLPVL